LFDALSEQEISLKRLRPSIGRKGSRDAGNSRQRKIWHRRMNGNLVIARSFFH
jgi:hypothetical protein